MFEFSYDWYHVVFLTLFSGLAMALGAFIASHDIGRSHWGNSEFRHSVGAFGGGALLSAVALILVPEGIKHLSLAWVVLAFASGGFVFAIIDVTLARSGTQAGNLVAMLSDFVPEALALGASCAHGGDTALLLAFLIALQNAPEGYNTYWEMVNSGSKGHTVISKLALVSLLGPLAGLAGFFLLDDKEAMVSFIMLFASGGILYLVFQDIAPQSKVSQAWKPALGSVLGFLLGLVGHILTHGAQAG